MRVYLLWPVLILAATTSRATADYLEIRADLKNVVLHQSPQGNMAGNQGVLGGGNLGGGNLGGGNKGAFGQPAPQGPGNNLGVPPPAAPEEEQLWTTVYLEYKGKLKPSGPVVQIDNHHFGKNAFIPTDNMFLKTIPIQREPLPKEHAKTLKKWKDAKGIKDTKPLVNLAMWAWSHGLLKEFHVTMDELKNADPKHPAVKSYLKIQSDLKAPFTQEEPSTKKLVESLQTEGYRTLLSDKGHYALVTNLLPPLPATDALVKRRLARLEDALESFYYWFALHDNVPVPPMPRYRLFGILVNSEEGAFHKKHQSWGSPTLLADGFTPRRDNIMVISAKRVDDTYTFLDREMRQWLPVKRATTDELLSGDVWKRADTKGPNALPFAILQTMAIVQKAMEEESERTTLSHEAVRQLLAASGLLPRGVAAPEWVQEGVASYFEIPLGAVYGAGGLPSWSNLVPFKTLMKEAKSRDVLYDVLTDRYFKEARDLSGDAGDGEAAEKAHEAWERARATAWALVYYLVKEQKFDEVLRYTNELALMPRDLDLNERVLEACFAKAFSLGAAKSGLQLDPAALQSFADKWFEAMKVVDLEVVEVEQRFHDRTKLNQPQNGPLTKSKGPPRKGPPRKGPPGRGVPPPPPPGS